VLPPPETLDNAPLVPRVGDSERLFLLRLLVAQVPQLDGLVQTGAEEGTPVHWVLRDAGHWLGVLEQHLDAAVEVALTQVGVLQSRDLVHNHSALVAPRNDELVLLTHVLVEPSARAAFLTQSVSCLFRVGHALEE